MEEKWNALHNEMYRDTTELLRGAPATLEQSETGYKIALGYWEEVKNLVRQNGFHTEDQEIGFFSSVKPKFTGQLEYFLLLYQHRLFCPPGKSDTTPFFIHEIEKIERFRDLHNSFINFYRNRKKDPVIAQQYFLRRTFNPDRRILSRPYDANPDFFTNGDWILTQFIGNLHYHRFLLNDGR